MRRSAAAGRPSLATGVHRRLIGGRVRARVLAGALGLLGVLAALGLPGLAQAAPPPSLSARAGVMIAPQTGQILYGLDANRELPIASTTKLMTALVVLEHVHNLGTVFTEPNYYPAAADSQIGLVPGERMTVRDLLVALMLPSADDAAEDLAYNVGRGPGHSSLAGAVAHFVAMMNVQAQSLGLRHTHYSTPIGLDTPGNYSTATDLVRLAAYDLTHSAFLARIVALPARRPALRQSGPRRHQPQRSRRPLPVDRRRQDRAYRGGRLRPRRLGAPQGHELDRRRSRHRVHRVPGCERAGAPRLRLRRIPARQSDPRRPGAGPARGAIPLRISRQPARRDHRPPGDPRARCGQGAGQRSPPAHRPVAPPRGAGERDRAPSTGGRSPGFR